jgi:hypothetical protein
MQTRRSFIGLVGAALAAAVVPFRTAKAAPAAAAADPRVAFPMWDVCRVGECLSDWERVAATDQGFRGHFEQSLDRFAQLAVRPPGGGEIRVLLQGARLDYSQPATVWRNRVTGEKRYEIGKPEGRLHALRAVMQSRHFAHTGRVGSCQFAFTSPGRPTVDYRLDGTNLVSVGQTVTAGGMVVYEDVTFTFDSMRQAGDAEDLFGDRPRPFVAGPFSQSAVGVA